MGRIMEFSIIKARKIQNCIAQKVVTQDQLPKQIIRIAGVDVTYTGDLAIGAATVLDYSSLEVLETQTVTQQARFPYIPTLFSFRELPVIISAIRKLNLQPDVVLIDGHGIAHPYRCGLASHLGVTLGKPTIGVAKNILIGEVKQVGQETFLIDEGETVGAVIPSFGSVKPVYVSIGHMVSLKTAVEVVKHCLRSSRIPEPINTAHMAASKERKNKIIENIVIMRGHHVGS